ncbi:MAG: ATP-dependent DNA ligase [Pseudomonadota bacterium]
MKRFATLYAELDASTATNHKLAALQRYFEGAEPKDAAWAVYFLAGGKPRRLVSTALLRSLACNAAGIEDDLFEACYQAVGDLAETLALVWPAEEGVRLELGLAAWVTERLLPLRALSEDAQAVRINADWAAVTTPERFLLTKLISGGFRVGVSKLLVQRALATHAGLDPARVAQRMMGYTQAQHQPQADDFARLIAPGDGVSEPGQPYPFYLAHPVPPELDEAGLQAQLGAPADWLVEWKYDGIRAQVVRRGDSVWIWSRGEELITERFPEIVDQAQTWPVGTVLDGELLVWRQGRPGTFQDLQTRINRKTLSAKLLAANPVRFLAYDLLAWNGEDWRTRPLAERRAQLEVLAASHGLDLSPLVDLPASTDGTAWSSWLALRQDARERGVEGFMLKHRGGPYGSGRHKVAGGGWWKWKLDPYTVDAVLIYAQVGHGRRASVYTDYTFAVWNRPPASPEEAQAVVQAIAAGQPATPGGLQLVPFAKAYSGLTDAEFKTVDAVIRRDTLEKFGPVRSVRPTMVFELGFEGIQRSSRHKSGIAVRFPRMLRIRDDKPLWEADSLPQLMSLLPVKAE